MKTIKLTQESWEILTNYKISNKKKNYSETILMLDNFIEKGISEYFKERNRKVLPNDKSKK